MTRVADTSALYALFDAADAHHARARDEVADPDPIVVPSEILVETVNLIEYRFSHDAARRALAKLLDRPHISIAEQVHIEAVQSVYANDQGRLSLADAFVVQTCRALGAKPLAFDKDILDAVG